MTLLAVSTAPPSALKDTVTEAPICTAEVASPEFMDESCEAFGAYGKREEQEYADEEENSTTVWHLLCTIYLPVLFFRLRRSFFGLAGFVRYILFGQCVQFLTTLLSPSAPWLQPLLGNAKDPNAWPPPTLKLLAILTIITFIVHPDGMTWIMLGKLRNAFYTIMESSCTCWNYVIADFGMLTTLMALATFGSMLFLVFIVHRTLASRTPPQTTKPDCKKKKRKGNHPRGGRGRIKGKGKHHATLTESRQQPGPPVLSPPRAKQAEEEETETCNNAEEDQTSIDTSLHKTDFLPKELTRKGSTAETDSCRPRIESSSTVDTAAMDDQSIESASVASAPSATSTVVSSRSPRALIRLEEGKKKDNKKRTNKRGKKGSASSKGYGVVVASPSRPAYVGKPPSQNENSPVSLGNVTNTGLSRSRRGGTGNQNATINGRPVRSLADRMSSPVPTVSNDSLFSTPLSSPTDTHARVGKPNTDPNVPSLQTPILTPPTPSSSLFYHEPTTPTPSFYGIATQPGRTNTLSNPTMYNASETNRGGYMTTGKIELTAFLARVGIVGTACEDLVEALDNVDGLYRLSDAQFELYNVSPDEKHRIDMMLEARRRVRAEATLVSSTAGSSIRPPPGLSVPPADNANQTTVRLSPPCLNPATYTSESGIPPVGYMATSRTDVDFGSSPPMSGSNTQQIPSLSLLSSYNVSNSGIGEQADEEIEAELQELGGQMIGSVLDFEG